MYPINEIFYSLQGEGFHTGTPSVFIRFSGCNLRCAFCDTQHSNHTMMSLPEIIDRVSLHPLASLIVLTGGEPSLHVDDDLIKALRMTGKTITIETNGTVPIHHGIDWVTLSPKTAFEGGDLKPCVITQCDELKVVYTGQDLTQYNNIKAKHRFLQPCFVTDHEQQQANVQDCINAVLTHPNWRLSLQTHRILCIR